MNIKYLLKTVLANPGLLKVNPAINIFFMKYLNKFKLIDVDGYSVIHSHLPPVNSKSFSHFVKKHMLAKVDGPSHAQIGVTNICPYNCKFCYNKNRSGKIMNKEDIKRIIKDLEEMGITWLGFTGGEPLLNKDLVEIVDSVSDNCITKLFTTGYNLDNHLASDLKKAGLFYVSVSLDHWLEEKNDKTRGKEGAYRTALKAIEIFKNNNFHVSVSAVLDRKMIAEDMEKFLEFLISLDIHEAWLSEIKPSAVNSGKDINVITVEEQKKLIDIQDKYNKEKNMTVNYLGHFEGKEHFGCSAGKKMVYVDAFGEVSPCVFTQLSFGNIKKRPIKDIYREMSEYFPTEDYCFINKNYRFIQKYNTGVLPLPVDNTKKMMEEVSFGDLSDFYKLYYR